MTRSASRWPTLVVAAALCGLVATGCDGDDDPDPSGSAALESGGSGSESSDAEPPEVDACALGAETIVDIYPDATAKPSTGETDGYDCIWTGEDPAAFTSLEVTLAMWDAGSYSTLNEMRVDFETDMTTFRPVEDLGEEGWLEDSYSGNEVSWRTADFTVALGGLASEGLTNQQLIRFARAIDADLPGGDADDETEATDTTVFEVDACTLGVDGVEQIIGAEFESRPLSDAGESRCTWEAMSGVTGGSSIDVYVSAYEPTTFLNTFGGYQVTGLGEEAWASLGANGDLNVAWHNGVYVVEIDMIDATLDVTEDQLLDLAYAVDADLPAE